MVADLLAAIVFMLFDSPNLHESCPWINEIPISSYLGQSHGNLVLVESMSDSTSLVCPAA